MITFFPIQTKLKQLALISTIIAPFLTLFQDVWVYKGKAGDRLNLKELNTNYDFIVVGGGGAGMIVATRIGNNSKNYKVLLIEAGGNPSPLNNIPSGCFLLLNQPANTYVYNSVPQTNACQNCDGKRALTTRGKMLGGSTGTNFMMYVRGNKEDYNRWSKDFGDEQWSYKNVLPYFKKTERYTGYYANNPDFAGYDYTKYHGIDGLLDVSTYDYRPGESDFLAAAKEKGYKLGDYNGPDQEVFSPVDITAHEGLRASTYNAFYLQTKPPPNLTIVKYAFVTNINFDGTQAVSLTLIKNGVERTITAAKEIIISAGAINSPQLLMFSGVGPAGDLGNLKIPVVADLPVGQNFQDHTYTLVGPFLKPPSFNPNRDAATRQTITQLLQGKGPLAAPVGIAGLAFFKSPYAKPDYLDMEFAQFAASIYKDLPRDFNKFLGLRTDLLTKWFGTYSLKETDAKFILLFLGRPKSVGTLKLASRNPMDPPILDPKYLEHPDDLKALFWGYKKIVELYENTRALNTSIFPNPVPGCEDLKFKSDKYYKCAITAQSGSLYHHVGSNSMGYVVHPQNLTVKGLHGLRVIDASVIPRTPNANTQAATFLVAEKGAEFIMKHYDMS